MREIKTVALIGLGAIGCSIARELRQAVGRPTEVAMLAGELCRLGREHGVPTPINDLFYHMIRVLEQKHKKDVL